VLDQFFANRRSDKTTHTGNDQFRLLHLAQDLSLKVRVDVGQKNHFVVPIALGELGLETLKDVAFRVNPLTDIDVKEMVQSVKAYKILKGARGEGSANIDKIEETLLRLSQLVTDFSFIKELDINPLKISDKTAEGVAVDGRIEVNMEQAKKALGLGCCCSGNCCS